MTEANSLNAATTGIVGNTGTSFTGTSVTQYNVLVGGSTSSTLTNVAPSATSGVPVISQGASANPVFGTAVVAGGGTGAVTLTGVLTGNGTSAITANTVTQYGTVVAGASNAVTSVAPSATSGVPLISQGAASNPAFGTAVVAGGGTGNASTTAYALIAGGTTTTGAFQAVTNGAATSTVLIGNGTSVLPSFSATPQLTALGIGAAAGASGLTFDGTNLLSNYATGTFTPTRVGASVAGTTTYTGQGGNYVRIGPLIWIRFTVLGSAATGTGNIQYGGLPFTVNASYDARAATAFLVSQTWPAATTSPFVNVTANATTAVVYGQGSAVAQSAVQMANAAFNEQFTIIYSV